MVKKNEIPGTSKKFPSLLELSAAASLISWNSEETAFVLPKMNSTFNKAVNSLAANNHIHKIVRKLITMRNATAYQVQTAPINQVVYHRKQLHWSELLRCYSRGTETFPLPPAELCISSWWYLRLSWSSSVMDFYHKYSDYLTSHCDNHRSSR